MIARFFIFVTLISLPVSFGFCPQKVVKGSQLKLYASNVELSRRSLLNKFAISSFGTISGFALGNRAARASGGATAGGVYLLSAKQRYNARVASAMRAFIELEASLKEGSFDKTKAYLTSEEDGAWKDGSTAGYLLANAFRRSSSTAPDSLPSVKKWKAFVAQVDALAKSTKKKDTNGALTAYAQAKVALDEYLEQVELQL